MELSIIIINHNTRALTEQTVESVLRTVRKTAYEIVVVDNSNDSGEYFRSSDPHVTVLERVENHGFGHACNLGAGQAQGKYLLFLNSDTIAGEQAIDESAAYIRRHEDVGVLGVRTYLASGQFDAGCRRGFPTPAASLYYFLGLDQKHPESRKYGAYHQTFLPEDQTSETDCVSGAYLMMPHHLFNELGGFDEDFFMYGEDVDLCYRVKQRGYKVVYYADAQIVHLKGESGLKGKSKDIIFHFHNAMKLFYRKHYQKKYSIFVTAAVYLGIWAKYHFAMLRRKKG